MAQFVIHLGISPSDYWAMTLGEHDALVAEFNRIQKSKRKG